MKKYLHNLIPHRDIWKQIFGSNDVEIASNLPLWISEDDYNDDPLAYQKPLIGNWKSVVGKQWRLQTQNDPNVSPDPCKGSVDLDSFALTEVPIDPSALTPPSHMFSCKTTVDGLRYRLCPNTTLSCTAVGQYPIGTMVDFTCQTMGEPINGDWDTKYVRPTASFWCAHLHMI